MNRRLMLIGNKLIVGVCATLLFVATVVAPVTSYADYQGGAATGRTSEGMQTAQNVLTKVVAAWGLINSTISLIAHLSAYMFAFNFDVLNIAVDAWNLDSAMKKKGSLAEQPPPLQAAVRQIGGIEDLEGECTPNEYKTCNESNAILDHTEVHVQTLQNTGLESLSDVSGGVLTEPEQLIAATGVIQIGFCMPNVFEADQTPSAPAASGGTAGAAAAAAAGQIMTDAEKADCTKRREGNLQLVAAAGVARADLSAAVSNTEKKAGPRLTSYAGSGDGVTANIKVLAGLDLTLAQRLNLINMLQGQQVANEAAIALHELEGMEAE